MKEQDFVLLVVLLLPFLGTSLGSMGVFFLKKGLGEKVRRSLSGFAAGVMTAASVWSLLIPAMDHSESMGKFAFVPAVVGFMLGIFFLLVLDMVIPHVHVVSGESEGPKSRMSRTMMMVFAVALHNIPEGMAVGVVCAGWLSGETSITAVGALSLSIGIALQNFPEGAIVSMPLSLAGGNKMKSFWLGVFSGALEPVAAVATILLSGYIVPVLPYLLSFAAGAMIYVVVEELVPDMAEGGHSNVGTISYALGFALMMMLDVALS